MSDAEAQLMRVLARFAAEAMLCTRKHTRFPVCDRLQLYGMLTTERGRLERTELGRLVERIAEPRTDA